MPARRPALRSLRSARSAVLLGAVLALALGTAASIAASPAAGATSVHYAVVKPTCAAPRPGQMACMALQVVDVPKGTKNAFAYQTPGYATGPKGGLTPADLALAYRYTPSSSRGASQTIALIDAYNDPTIRNDLNAFDRHYHLRTETATSFRVVNQSGKTAPLPTRNSDWAVETALDVEAARAVCNRCKILLVEAGSDTGGALATAVNTAARLGATEISNSYGGPELPAESSAIRRAYDHHGIVITASTGDFGWYGWDEIDDGYVSDNAASSPASYPTVVAVGGTTLKLNANGTRNSETVWNRNGPDNRYGSNAYEDLGATGGGCSKLYSAQWWQKDVAGYTNTGCGTKRLAGDVSVLGDPNPGFDIYTTTGGSGWKRVGGTSLSSPLVAAMWALSGGSGGAWYPAQSLYDHLRYAASAAFDVTSGGNGYCGGDTTANCSYSVAAMGGSTSGNPNNLYRYDNTRLILDCSYATNGSAATVAANTQCNATTGYDGPSGVGTPNGLSMFNRMGPYVSWSVPSLIKRNATETFHVRFSDNIPHSTLKTYTWSWGDGHTTTTTATTITHRWTKRGTYPVSVRATDSNGRTSPATTKRYAVGYAPSVGIAGGSTVHHNRTHAWSARVTEHNTGGKVVRYVWRINGNTNGTTSRLRHKFSRTGRYRVSLTATDSSGLHTTRTITVNVTW